jgi:radical SAM superfamily enzyme YgiQ (UPF0313 family)
MKLPPGFAAVPGPGAAPAPGVPQAPICLIQPPFVQLNSPYPSLYYLRSFLEGRGRRVTVLDHSIGLFERIFCRPGLERIFADAEVLLNSGGRGGAGAVLDRQSRGIARSFLSEAERWINTIDRLVNFLRGRDREWGHFLALANGALPGGPRFDACLDRLEGNPLPEQAPLLASKLLADLADFITGVLDPGFSLIRYSGRPGGRGGAGDAAAGRLSSFVRPDGYILRTFYGPHLEETWAALGFASRGEEAEGGKAGPFVLGFSIPFPGCLTGALYAAASAKARFGDRVTVIAGGGYVNTELRFLSDPAVFDYVDYLSFDRGYGSLAATLERVGNTAVGTPETAAGAPPEEAPLYKTMFRLPGNRIIADSGIAGGGIGEGIAGPQTAPCRGEEIDDWAAVHVFPDYRGLDFSRYICAVDDVNPMHRLWTDGRWLKAYLAHGCYWQRCGFCDTTLDYIRCYKKVDPRALYRHLRSQAETTQVWGLHLVDEAAPPASLARLALLNLGEAGTPLIFWGNIRFERAFDPDMAALLAAGGLAGVSGGIEIATEEGFKRVGKGITLEGAVRCCAAFKEAGVLTHAYLIYGYWDQDEQEIVDSAEILRQFFAAGLLDSAFWHPFVLTRHAGLYAKLAGNRGFVGGDEPGASAVFALNDLSFKGEERFRRYDEPLDRLLAAWMAGDTAAPVAEAFPFKVKRPRAAPDLVASLIDAYARDRDLIRRTLPTAPSGETVPSSEATPPQGLVFLGSRVWEDGARLRWRWRLREHSLAVPPSAAAPLAALLAAARPPSGAGSPTGPLSATLYSAGPFATYPAGEFYARLVSLLGTGAPRAWQTLREGGLVALVTGNT